MARKPIFLATHSRSCSTAFERIFMTCQDTIECFHEPFGEAFYFGPEMVSPSFKDNRSVIKNSGAASITYGNVLQDIQKTAGDNPTKDIFIKDIVYHIVPPSDSIRRGIPPSLMEFGDLRNESIAEIRGQSESNPTLLPKSLLHKFHFTFLIRDPHLSIPSLYRCILSPKTNIDHFNEEEIGYRELRILVDYLSRELPNVLDPGNSFSADRSTELRQKPLVTLIDASDLQAHPTEVVQAYCSRIGIPFSLSMLSWDAGDPAVQMKLAKFAAYHEDALASTGFRVKDVTSSATGEAADPGADRNNGDYDDAWTKEFDEEAVKTIRSVVEKCWPDYVYLRALRLVPGE